MDICTAKSDFFIEKFRGLEMIKVREIKKDDQFEYIRIKVKWNPKKSEWKIVREGQIGRVRYEVFLKGEFVETFNEEDFNLKYETRQDKRERVIESLSDDLFYDM